MKEKNCRIDVSLFDKLINDVPMFVNKPRISFSKEVREQALERDNHKCGLCNSTECLLLHHVVPRGEAVLSNGITLCTTCHICVHLLLSFFRGYPYYTVSEVREWRNRGGILRYAAELQDRTIARCEAKIKEMELNFKKGLGGRLLFYETEYPKLLNEVNGLYDQLYRGKK